MSFEKLKPEITAILNYYKIENIAPVLFTLSQYNTILKVEIDLEKCNKIILGKELKHRNERYLNYPALDAEVVIEPGDDFVTISIDFIFDDGDVYIPTWLFASLLELVGAHLKLNRGLFHKNHTVVERGSHHQGKRDGKWIQFYESTQIQKISFFDHGKPTGIWEAFFENGNLKSQQNFNFNDYRSQLLLEWREDKTPKTIWNTVTSSQQELDFKHNGIIKTKWRLTPGKEVIEKIGYHEDGSVQSKSYLNLRGNLADGEHLFYNHLGKLTGRVMMENGEEKL